MKLYLDLNKAVQVPNTGTNSRTERQSSRSYKDSFNTTHSGVLGGDPSHDDPDVGKRWPKDDHADEDLEADRQRDSEISQQRNLTPKKKNAKPEEDEDEAEASSTQKAIDIVKSFSEDLKGQLRANVPNPTEVEYLMEERGYSYEDILKGRASIYGFERQRFDHWLQERLRKSIDRLNS